MRATRSERRGPTRRGCPAGRGRPLAARGLTLVELTIGILLALVVILAAHTLHLGVDRSFKAGARKLLAQQEATLLATGIGRRVRVASDFRIYALPDRDTPADSGNGLALWGADGSLLGRLEWSEPLQTLVDSTGAPVTSMKLQALQFLRDPTQARAVRYRFKVDDERGNLVDVESAVCLRN